MKIPNHLYKLYKDLITVDSSLIVPGCTFELTTVDSQLEFAEPEVAAKQIFYHWFQQLDDNRGLFTFNRGYIVYDISMDSPMTGRFNTVFEAMADYFRKRNK